MMISGPSHPVTPGGASLEMACPPVTDAAVAAIVIAATIRFAVAPILVPRMPNAIPAPRLSRFDTAPISRTASHGTLGHAPPRGCLSGDAGMGERRRFCPNALCICSTGAVEVG